MKLAVIIPTLGRNGQVTRLLEHLERQERLPDEVIVSAPDESHVGMLADRAFPVSQVFGPKGLCAQRNNALQNALARFDIVTFFDDDFIPAEQYLRLVVEAFESHADWAVVTGRVVKDGASNAGIAWEEGLEILRGAGGAGVHKPRVLHHVGAYGCNMSIRSAAVGELRFDERLALYGWQEDIDFTSQLRSRGRVVSVSTIVGVHLGVKTGRVSGERFGYSQIVNPLYLIRKGSVPAHFALPLMFRNVAANMIGSVRPEPYIDRRGRLRGNLHAALHVLKGRIEPEYILRIQS